MCHGRLSGRVAVISGAAGGIGRSIAQLFLQEGAGVVLGDLDEQSCKGAAVELNRCGYAGHAVGAPLDVTEPESWDHVMRVARRRFGYPTILVNNAGTLGLHGLQGVSEEEWSRVLDVCQRGTWLGMRAAVPCMQLGGGGAVVNVASVFGLVGSGVAFAYHAAKGAVRAMTTAAAVELAGRGIRVNAVYPGLIETPMTAWLSDQFVGDFVEATPMGRQGTAEEVARAVLFLGSDEASFITGAELVIDGGHTSR